MSGDNPYRDPIPAPVGNAAPMASDPMTALRDEGHRLLGDAQTFLHKLADLREGQAARAALGPLYRRSRERREAAELAAFVAGLSGTAATLSTLLGRMVEDRT